ncbi:MAG: hypothetical protein Q4A00_03525 [Flavobacteriaceae bacterium]|nr:hypothetical protein [Flavobacteriaceae bacterium]
MKKLILLLLICVWGVSSAQIKKVGINTHNRPEGEKEPKYTLDIEGTMRIQTTGTASNAQPLGWDPDTKQVVKGPRSWNNDSKVYHRFYKIKVAGRDFSKIKVEAAKLGIDATKWDAVLIKATLMTENFRWDNPDAGKAFVQLLGIKGNTKTPATIKNMRINPADTDLVYVLPKTKIVNEGGQWVFYGDYPETQAATTDVRHMWLVDVLVAPKL